MRAPPDRLAHYAIYTAIAAERFAFYLMLSGLVLALVAAGTTPGEASNLYGSLLFAVYLAPLAGGALGGKLSLRATVALGAALLTVAYSVGAAGYLVPMLALIALGCGCFKPCLNALLSLLYPSGDVRKVKAQSTYYLWIQLGSLPSAAVGGWLRIRYGWGAAYAAAALGALIALCAICFAWRRLTPYRNDLETLVGIRLDYSPTEAGGSWQWGSLSTILVGAVLFWAANQQQGSTLTFWADTRIDRHGIPAESFASLNPLFVGLLTPFAAWLAPVLTGRTRLVGAMTVVAVSFAVLLSSDGLGTFVLSYFLGAAGELLISPFGMGTVTELVPRKRAALGVAAWLLTTAIGGYAAGRLGGLHPETAAAVTVGLALLGAAWFAWRWPVAGASEVGQGVRRWRELDRTLRIARVEGAL